MRALQTILEWPMLHKAMPRSLDPPLLLITDWLDGGLLLRVLRVATLLDEQDQLLALLNSLEIGRDRDVDSRVADVPSSEAMAFA